MLNVTLGVSLESYSGYHSVRKPIQCSLILEQKYREQLLCEQFTSNARTHVYPIKPIKS